MTNNSRNIQSHVFFSHYSLSQANDIKFSPVVGGWVTECKHYDICQTGINFQ